MGRPGAGRSARAGRSLRCPVRPPRRAGSADHRPHAVNCAAPLKADHQRSANCRPCGDMSTQVAHARIDPASTPPSCGASPFAVLILRMVAPVLCAGLGFSSVLASSVVVPDVFPTVQSAIDSGADTVLIREGTYPERPVIDHPVVLQGIGTSQRPRLDGLEINNSVLFLPPWFLIVNQIVFSGRVNHTTVAVHPRNLHF